MSPTSTCAVMLANDTSLRSGYPLLGTLPEELIIEIMGELDWYSLMNVRKTCRYLRDISKTLSIWRRQVYQYANRHKFPTQLEATLDTFSASGLEEWVTRRVSADAGWESANMRPTRTRNIDRKVSRACLVPGGRWLLIGSEDGDMLAYDLDAPVLQGKLLFEVPNNWKIESMCISLDADSPKLAFKLALSLTYKLFRLDEIHIWNIVMIGRGHDAYLDSLPLQSFRAPSNSIQVFNTTLRDDLFARILHGADGSCLVEAFRWRTTTSEIPCKQTIHLDKTIHHIQLIPGERLLVFTKEHMMVYDVQSLFDQDSLSPRWKLPCPRGNRTANGGISEPLIDTTCTQFTFVAENPNTVYNLTIPHDISKSPVVSKVTSFLPGDHYPAIAIGFEKMFIAFERNWRADCDKLSGSVIRLGITDACPQCWESEVVRGIHSYEYPTEWYVGWPPLLDEGSGRIVQPFGRKGLLVLDTALSFMAQKH